MHPRDEMVAPGQAGYSLLELLVAFAILAVSVAALAGLAARSISATTTSGDRAAGASLAAEKMEELRNQAFDTVASGSDSDVSAGGEAGGVFSRTWTVTTTTVQGIPAKDIRVTTTWTEGGAITFESRVVDPRTVMAVTEPEVFEAFRSVSIKSWNRQ